MQCIPSAPIVLTGDHPRQLLLRRRGLELKMVVSPIRTLSIWTILVGSPKLKSLRRSQVLTASRWLMGLTARYWPPAYVRRLAKTRGNFGLLQDE